MNTLKSYLALAVLCSSTLCAFAQAGDFFEKKIVEINMTIDDDGWHDSLVVRKKRDDKTPVIAQVTVDGQPYSDIEVRYKGNSSFHGTLKHGGNKLPIKMEAPKGVKFADSYKELRLSNNFRDPSAVRELLAYEIASTYVPVPRSTSAVVTINGEYIGVYTMTEGMSKRMLKEYYCNDDGVLVKCDPDFHKSQSPGCPKGEYSNLKYLGEDPDCYKALYHAGSGKKVTAIMELARNLHGDSDPDSYMSVHEALWMHALNNVMVNLDSYLGIFTHNYFIYKDEHGMFHPMIWDLNLAFGGFATLDQKVNPDLYKLSPIVHDRYLQDRRPLIQSLTKDRRHMLTYFYMIETIVNDWIVTGKYVEVATAFQDEIRPYRSKEVEPLYPMSDFEVSLTETVKRGNNRSIPGIQQLMETRKDYLLAHPLLDRNYPEMLEWSHTNSGDNVVITINTASEITEAYVYYKDKTCGKLQKAKLHPLSGVTWATDPINASEFYVQMGTEKGYSLSPSNAPGAIYTIDN